MFSALKPVGSLALGGCDVYATAEGRNGAKGAELGPWMEFAAMP
ncbi:MAG: hypothetical protein ACLQKA_13660 [Bryobacteraceae bacterium]